MIDKDMNLDVVNIRGDSYYSELAYWAPLDKSAFELDELSKHFDF